MLLRNIDDLARWSRRHGRVSLLALMLRCSLINGTTVRASSPMLPLNTASTPISGLMSRFLSCSIYSIARYLSCRPRGTEIFLFRMVLCSPLPANYGTGTSQSAVQGQLTVGCFDLIEILCPVKRKTMSLMLVP